MFLGILSEFTSEFMQCHSKSLLRLNTDRLLPVISVHLPFSMLDFRCEIIKDDPTRALRITGTHKNNGELRIPGTFSYAGQVRIVREIGEGAFEGKQFTHIFLPASVEVLGDRAFARNPFLVGVYYARATPPRLLGDQVFSGCVQFREMEQAEPQTFPTAWFWAAAATVGTVVAGLAIIRRSRR
jgi:hypothetical protein